MITAALSAALLIGSASAVSAAPAAADSGTGTAAASGSSAETSASSAAASDRSASGAAGSSAAVSDGSSAAVSDDASEAGNSAAAAAGGSSSAASGSAQSASGDSSAKNTESPTGSSSATTSKTPGAASGSASSRKSLSLRAPRITRVSSGRRVFTVRYDKVTGASGYEVRYSIHYDMSRSTRKDRKSSRSLTVRNLKSEGIYFVQVRAYGKTNGKKVYSKWSEKKAAKYVYYRSNLTEVRALSLLKNTKNSRSRNALQYALARAGHPYSQARRHSGIYYDCSSLAYYAYRSAGVKIASGRDFTAAGEAYRLRGKRVSYSSMKPGALIFFSYGRNGRYRNITHVAMYAGRGMLIEAANSRIGVVYRPIHSRGSIVMICDPAK